MKIVNILVASALVSGITMTSAQAMGEGGNDYNTFVLHMSDTNGDGKMSKDEFMKMSAKMAAKEFMMMDMNDDGSVSKEEYMFRQTNR